MSKLDQIVESIIVSYLTEKIKKRKYKGKTYKAPESMVKAKTWDEKIKQASSWADNPEAAAAAATIVKSGKPPGKD